MSKSIIDNYNEELFAIYKQHELISLEDNNFTYKNINVMDCPKNSDYREPKFRPLINLWDIINCTKDLKFFVGQMYLHRPYINNPTVELDVIKEDQLFSVYFQNLYDRRYCSFVTCCYEKSYNFWDRIGDLLASFFPELLKINLVNFSKIVDELEKQKIEDEHFDWILNFKKNEYKILNDCRKNLVHYHQYESKYRFDHSMNNTDLDIMYKLWNEKSSFPEYFKEHLHLAADGYYNVFKFLRKVKENRNFANT